MDADLKKIKKLTEYMKKNGLLSLKVADIELNLDPRIVFQAEHSPDTTPEVKEEPQDPMATLLWSTQDIPPEEVN